MLQLAFEATPLAVVQIKPSETIPSALLEAITENSEFLSITRTKFETSVVLPWDECERAFAQVKVSEMLFLPLLKSSVPSVP